MTDTPSEPRHQNEQHGFPLHHHHDETGTLRSDLYRKAMRHFGALAAQSPATWQSVGPAPATVNAYLAQNGQMPGPNTGSVLDIAIDPSGTSDSVVYLVSNDGGIWKTIDGGDTWNPLTDALSTLCFGSIALDPNSSATVYAGTGNSFSNGYFKGIGIYKSTDGGGSWTLMAGSSVFEGNAIDRLVVTPTGALLVASTIGLWRCSDGVNFVQVVLGPGAGVRITDLKAITGDPTRILACGSGIGVYLSSDGGASFSPLWSATNGAPAVGTYSFVSVAASSDGNTLYANVEKNAPSGTPPCALGVYKSVDAGKTWTDITTLVLAPSNWTRGSVTIPDWRRPIAPQLGYDQTLGVDPQDANRVYMGFQDLWLSTDGGQTWADVTYNSAYTTELMHVDHHALTFAPAAHRQSGAPTPLWVGNDGGVWKSVDGGATWINRNGNRATNLFRCVDMGRGAGNNAYVYGGMQDTGTGAGNVSNGVVWAEWGGGDGGAVAVDPTDGKRAYGLWGGPLYTTDGGVTHNWSNVQGGALPYSDISVDGAGVVYLSGGATLFRSVDNGANFALFLKTAESQPIENIFTNASDASIVWLALRDGSVTKVTISNGSPSQSNTAIPGAIAGQVPSLAVDNTNANRVLAVFRGYSGQVLPSRHVFYTQDGGQTWKDVSGGLPGYNVGDMSINAAAIDSNYVPSAFIVSSDFGVLRSLDSGNSWHRLGKDLPNVNTVNLAIDTTVNPSLLTIGTYGRSAWQISLPQKMLRPVSTSLWNVGTVTWSNATNQPVKLSWIDLSGSEIQFATLAPGSSESFGPAYFNGVNIVRDGNGTLILANIINGNPNQTVTISQAGLEAAQKAGITILSGLRAISPGTPAPNFTASNASSRTLDLFLLDALGGRILIGRFAPGVSSPTGPNSFGNPYIWTDESGIVSTFVATAAESQTFLANDEMIAFWQK